MKFLTTNDWIPTIECTLDRPILLIVPYKCSQPYQRFTHCGIYTIGSVCVCDNNQHPTFDIIISQHEQPLIVDNFKIVYFYIETSELRPLLLSQRKSIVVDTHERDASKQHTCQFTLTSLPSSARQTDEAPNLVYMCLVCNKINNV